MLITSDYNKHEWTFFVKFDDPNQIDKFVEKIVVSLHPTFTDPVVTFTKQPFKVTRRGWGVFDIPVKIFWKKWTGLEPSIFSHFLSFEEDGKKSKFKVKIERAKIEANVGK